MRKVFIDFARDPTSRLNTEGVVCQLGIHGGGREAPVICYENERVLIFALIGLLAHQGYILPK